MTLEKRKKKKLFLKTTGGSLIEGYFSFDGGLSDEKRGLEILGRGEGFRLTRILSRESYREMFSQKMFRIKGNITLDELFFYTRRGRFFFFNFFQMEVALDFFV